MKPLTLNHRLKSLRQRIPRNRIVKRRTAPADLQDALKAWNGNQKPFPYLYSVLFSLAEDIRLTSRDQEYIHNRLRNDGLRFILIFLPSLGKALQKALSCGVWSNPASFAARGGRYTYPRFMCEKFERIFHKDGTLRSEPCISTIKHIYQICFFGYKADDSLIDPVAGAEKLDTLISTEEEILASVPWNFEEICPDETTHLMVVARRFISRILKHEECEFTGHPGPGAVADLKRDESRFDARIPYHWKYLHLINRSGVFFNITDSADRSYRYPCVSKDYKGAVTSKVVLVPKDARGPRVIASEPWFLQFLQQGVKDWLVPLLERHPLTAGHLNFTDQSINQKLVREGSVTKEWSTLDLKEASDRIALPLVYSLFRSNPLFLKLLMDVRSEYTSLDSAYDSIRQPKSKTLRLHKYAPMGSALCFPILALTVFAISVAAIAMSSQKTPDEARKDVFVYGDDVVVKTEHASSVISALESVGLLVNKDKSFVNSDFLESCGVDCFRGHDIQPIRMKAVPSFARKNDDAPNTIVSVIEKANHFADQGYCTTASFLLKDCERCLGLLPYVTPKSGIIGRYVHPLVHEFVCELNYEDGRGVYLGRRRGYETFKAFTLVPIPTELPTTGFGHMLRTHSQIGLAMPVSKFSWFDLPKNSLMKKVRWKPEFPKSDWVPRLSIRT